VLIYGRHPVREALLRGDVVERIWLQDDLAHRTREDIERLARARGVPILYVPRQKLDELLRREAPEVPRIRHQGVAARIVLREGPSFTELVAWVSRTRTAKGPETPLLLALDHWEDPQNVGAAIRTAVAVGAAAVLLPERRSAGVTPAVVKSSAGAAHILPPTRVPNLVRALQTLQEAGAWVIGAMMDGGKDYRRADYTPPTVLVVGSEGRGLSRLVLETCDEHVEIPMRGGVGSLNASVAAALLLYEAYRQRFPLS